MAQTPLKEPGELPNTTVTVSASRLHQMGRRLSHLRSWVTHLVGKVRKLGDENARLRELAHWQAKQIEHLEEGIPVGQSPTQPPVTNRGTAGCIKSSEGPDMPSVQGDTSCPSCVGLCYSHCTGMLMARSWYRLDPCRHLFCVTCIIKVFREQGREVLWYTCPRCTCAVSTTPPLADRGVGPIAAWLRTASGTGVPAVEELLHLEKELGDICSWDLNNHLLSGATVGDPTRLSHSALFPAPLQ